MSGIAGILRFDGEPASLRDVERLARTMAQRGPDRVRNFVSGPAGLASQLLRVNEEDIFDAQPLQGDGLTLVADARIDNREDIAEALGIAADALAAISDSALIFHAYRRWGSDCAAHLIGDFVFAMWDSAANKLVVARDAMGQRPFSAVRNENYFAFASERRALYALTDTPRMTPEEMIAGLLPGRRPREEIDPGLRPSAGLLTLTGGCVLEISVDGTSSTRCYWEPHAAEEHIGKDLAYYVAAYRRILEEAVACRVRRAIRPPGIFLSGGFDSAAVTCLAARALLPEKKRLVAATAIRSEGAIEASADNKPWADIVRRFVPGIEHRYIAEGVGILDSLPGLFLLTQLPGNAFFTGAQRLFAALEADGAGVVMDGVGGDYTLNPTGAGYPVGLLKLGKFRAFAADIYYRLRRGLSPVSVLGGEVLLGLLPTLRAFYREWKIGKPLFGSQPPINPEMALQLSANNVRRGMFGTPHAVHLQALKGHQSAAGPQYGELAASHGLELTRPFHDQRVIELALAIPEEFLRVRGIERYIGRKALADILPPQFQMRPKGNETLLPDYLDQVERLRPEILAEIDRMAASELLTGYFDFPQMKKLLLARPRHRQRLNVYTVNLAMRGFQLARYIEWVRGSNR